MPSTKRSSLLKRKMKSMDEIADWQIYWMQDIIDEIKSGEIKIQKLFSIITPDLEEVGIQIHYSRKGKKDIYIEEGFLH